MNGWTLAFQSINFIILAAVLRRFLFQPLTRVVARRQADIAAAGAEAERARAEAQQSQQRYERELATLQAGREQLLEQTRALAAAERQRLMDQAARDAQALLDSARAGLERERHEAEQQLSLQGTTLGIELARRLLAEAAGADSAEVFLERLCLELEGLPPERARELRAQAAGAPEVALAVAPALLAATRERWAARIARLLSAPTVKVVDDPALIAGAELRLPQSIHSVSWRDGLERARQEFSRNAHAG